MTDSLAELPPGNTRLRRHAESDALWALCRRCLGGASVPRLLLVLQISCRRNMLSDAVPGRT
jgi:hypothetical protein